MKPETPDRLIRPVRCHVCAGQMFYSDDPNHIPEARVTVEFGDKCDHFCVHVSCWNGRMGKKPESVTHTP